MANVGKCLSCDGPATHLKPDEENPTHADPTCSDCCGGCSDSDCDANEWGTQSDNVAAAKAVAKTETPRGQRSPLNIPMNWEN